MTDQEQYHDAMHHANPSQNGPPFSAAAAVQEREETTERRPAGIIAHRDQFSEPEPFDGSEPVSAPEFAAGLKSLRRSLATRTETSRPVHCAPPAVSSKPNYQTLFLLSGYSIKPGPHGRIVLHGTTVFGKNVEVRMLEIKSIEPIFDFSDSTLELVSLKETAVKLFVTCENSPYDLRIYSFWTPYLQNVAIPVIENMIEHWIGASSPGISNPVAEYFYGRDGILRHQLDRDSIIHRINSATVDPVVPILTRYKGPAMVLVYER